MIKMNYKHHRALLSRAWKDFFVLKRDDIEGINDEIKASWIRSRNMGVDYVHQLIKSDDEKNQNQSIKKNFLFIDIARPYIDDLYKVINNTNFMITLLDKDGFVLDVLLHPKVIEITNFTLINLSEERVGTNAMGTCLFLDKPFQTYAEEHTHIELQKFTTAAAPIHDKTGELIGCIGITGLANDISTHTLGMAIAASYAIENKLILLEDKDMNLVKQFSSLNNNNIKIKNGNSGVKNKLYSFKDIIGDSDSIKEAIKIAEIASNGNSNILILGESGTGKELFAQSIHSNSSRKNKPFVDVNCGSLPLNLAESELFGYEGGSYTGSKKEGQPGKFELADGGTIFLDEIGELPLSIQVSLLRIIQERKVTRIGSQSSKDIDIMIIAATNKNLFESVQNNTFRGDLFYRLNVFNINLPPLREHQEDIPLLVENFIERYNIRFNRNIEGITEEALYLLKQYSWPGNIRELSNIIERAIQIAVNKNIEVRDLPIYITTNINIQEIKGRVNIGLMEKEEIKTINSILEKTRGNAKVTSEVLGISRATLYRKLIKYDIAIDKFRI
jgi:transcriptional regulator of acetoin/glycerol metabolism